MNVTGLRDYQCGHATSILGILRARGRVLDASECGTGKTYSTLAVCRELGVVPFVVGPKSSEMAWAVASDVIGCPVEFHNYELLRGKTVPNGADEEGDRRKLKRLIDSEWLLERPYGSGSSLMWKHRFDTIIFDEVHRCGGETSKNSKMLIAAHRQARRVIMLSATAADNPQQMKALGYALGLHELNAQTRDSYRNWLMRHGCTPGIFGGFDFTKNPAERMEVFQRLNAAIFPDRGARLRKRDIPGFPETLVENKYFSPLDEASRLSEELHAAYAFRQDQAKDAKGMEKVMRLRQAYELLKVPNLIDLFSDYSKTSKVVIFVNFTETLKALFKGLTGEGFHVDTIDGSQTGSAGSIQRARVIRQFQENYLDGLVVNNYAGGESMSLHDPLGIVERTALICPGWSARQAEQILGRVHRSGGAFSQQFFCTFWGTREEKLAKRLEESRFNMATLNDSDFIL